MYKKYILMEAAIQEQHSMEKDMGEEKWYLKMVDAMMANGKLVR